MSTELNVELGERRYPIRIGGGLLAQPEAFAELRGRPLRIVSDSNVAPLYLNTLLQTLGAEASCALVVPAGEQSKNWAQVGAIQDWLLGGRLARDGVVLALGGGVIGDLTGFCAAIYQRGVDFVQVPTTLLAQVDSSVGGKTGINHPLGKNLIGAFHQPQLVVADTAVLATLPPREISAGLAEIIKCGLLGDEALFAELALFMPQARALDPQVLAAIIRRCCELKARIVGLDERERVSGGPRALLNLGHTFGHAVEAWTHYKSWLHGEAVGLGLAMAADLSQRLGWLAPEAVRGIEAVLAAAGLPLAPPTGMTAEDFMRLMALDKKVARGQLRLVLLRRIGEAVLSADYPPEALAQTLAAFCRSAQELPA